VQQRVEAEAEQAFLAMLKLVRATAPPARGGKAQG
jgi:hypothetical protein